MRKSYPQNTVRYYLFVVFFLAFLFFSGDFGLTDVQKTAIVTAVGIDRQENTFIVTSQIAVPQSSKQGSASQSVQIVSRGKTVGEAFEEINAKTGWYPKLVFCDLVILGESAKTQDVFDALDFFLRDEYLSDNCQLAVCEGSAKSLLNTTALIDPSSSAAMKKVLSAHAERVGTVLPNTLREFSISYFSESASGYLPILKTEPQQEKIGENTGETQKTPPTQQNGGQQNQQENGQETDKPVFSARQTALFVHGKWVESLSADETFATSAVLSKLRLAAYTLPEETACTMLIKRNTPRIKLRSENGEAFTLSVEVTLTAGALDFSKSQPLDKIKDVGDLPSAYFTVAEKKLSGEIERVFEKCKACNCDLFGVRERLIKYEKRRLKKEEIPTLQNTHANVLVRLKNVR